MYTSIQAAKPLKPSRRQNRASLGAGKFESRNRKQEELEPNENQNRNPNAATKIKTKTTVPHTDNGEINSIVTNGLWSDNCQVVAEAMNSLYKLVDRFSNINADDNRKTAFRRGGHLAIVQAMIRNTSSYGIQRDGCLALMRISLCGLDGVRRDIVEIGGLKCCRRALEQFPDQSSVQKAGCKLIRNLWITPDIRRSVVNGGGLTVVLNAMTKLKEDTEVQNNGCKALFALLCDESTCAKAAVDAGCIEVVVAAMENCQHDAVLQMYGCKFLFALAGINKEYRSRIIQAKGLVAVVEATRIHEGDERVLSEVRHAVKAIVV